MQTTSFPFHVYLHPKACPKSAGGDISCPTNKSVFLNPCGSSRSIWTEPAAQTRASAQFQVWPWVPKILTPDLQHLPSRALEESHVKTQLHPWPLPHPPLPLDKSTDKTSISCSRCSGVPGRISSHPARGFAHPSSLFLPTPYPLQLPPWRERRCKHHMTCTRSCSHTSKCS